MALFSKSRLFLQSLTQIVYPRLCWMCGELQPPDGEPLCAACDGVLTRDPHPTCQRCSSTVGPHVDTSEGCLVCRMETFAFDGAIRLGPYEGILREAILRMKQGEGEGLAEILAPLAARAWASQLKDSQPAIVLPVPLFWTRRFQRGFNCNDLFAQALAKALDTSFSNRLLRRVRRTARQATLGSKEARRENVRDAFAVRKGWDLRDKTVVLVDDVLTTGATASACGRALRTLKPSKILVAVLGHGHGK